MTDWPEARLVPGVGALERPRAPHCAQGRMTNQRRKNVVPLPYYMGLRHEFIVKNSRQLPINKVGGVPVLA